MADAAPVAQTSLGYIIERARTSISSLETGVVDAFIQALRDARRVFVYGTGRSGLVARAFAIRLQHLGIQTYVIGETITAPVHEQDLVVLVSGSGKTYPVAMTSEIAKNLGARVAVVTGNRGQTVAKHADIIMELTARPGARTDKDRMRMAPLGTIFEASAWLLLDAVVADLMARMGENEETMRRRHATLE